jgi:hypothetical protein
MKKLEERLHRAVQRERAGEYRTARNEYHSLIRALNRIIALRSEKWARTLKSRIVSRLNRLEQSAREMKQNCQAVESDKEYDRFIQSLPDEIFTDRYGTIDDKIKALEGAREHHNDPRQLFALSFCHILKGNRDIAIDYLLQAKKLVN